MGDADRNLDEQIRGVEVQIRGVEVQIRSVEEEIRKLEQKIERVEEQIETCSNLQEKAQLRGKEERLRDEKARLLGKEDRVRDEKARLLGKEAQLREQILQGRDKCTELDWLRQDLPSWNSGSFCKSPSATQRERMYTPVRVGYWDVVNDIEDYLNKADKLKRIYQKVDHSVFTRGQRNLVAIASFVVNSTCEFVSRKQPGSSVTFDGEVNLEVPPEFSTQGGESTNRDRSEAAGRDVQKCFFYARPPRVDVLIQSNGEAIAAFELKNGGLGCPVPIHRLWARCSCRTGINLNCWCNSNIPEGHARSILNCVLQLYEYLVLAKVGYGVLTDIQHWYLCKRDHGGCLYISTGFKLDGRKPPLAAAIAYLINSAVDGRGEFDVSPMKGERPWSWEAIPCASPSSGSKDDEDKDNTYKPNECKTGGYRTSPARTRRASLNATQNQLQEIAASDLHLDDRPITSGGWSGCVVGGTFNGRRVAVKLAPCNSERAEALLNEVGAYLKLREHWGVFVPPLVGYGTTADGQIVFIATKLIDGSPLGPGTVTEEVASAARQALGAVHACNLLHGDVEARNIMVVRGTQPSVRLIDFGFARYSSNRISQHAEFTRLERVLQEMIGVRVGKEPDVRYSYKQLCSV